MVKFEEANKRMFRNIFVCRRCKTKIRGPNIKVLAGKISCRKCGYKVLRPKKRK